MSKQIKFYDKENDMVLGGILLDDGNVICGCCGSIIESDDFNEDGGFKLLEKYNYWVDFTESIIGE